MTGAATLIAVPLTGVTTCTVFVTGPMENLVDIPSPTLPLHHPDRHQECATHMENAILGLWEFFEDAGWTEEEFNQALIKEATRASGSDER